MRERLIRFIRTHSMTGDVVTFGPILGDPEALALSGQLLGAMLLMDGFWASPRQLNMLVGPEACSQLVVSTGLAWNLPMLVMCEEEQRASGAIPETDEQRVDAGTVLAIAQPTSTARFLKSLEELYRIRVPRAVVLLDLDDGTADTARTELHEIGTEVRFLLTASELEE